MKTLQEDLRDLINKHGAENGSNTKDIILATYLSKCLEAFDFDDVTEAVRKSNFVRWKIEITEIK